MEEISPELLEILVCPETHQRLSLAPPDLLARLAERQAAGKLKNRAGDVVTHPVQAALAREDGAFAYLILEGIPIMLVDEAIPLNQLEA
jgi:uncharacterized protein YbaR (Trm112 family)